MFIARFLISLMIGCSFFLSVFNVAFAKALPSIKTPSFLFLQKIDGISLGAGALPIKTYVFESSKKENDIYNFYNKLWKGKIKTLKTTKWIYHSHFDGRYLFNVQVRVIEDKASLELTTGIIGISEPGAVKKENINKPSKLELFYPMGLGTKVLKDLQTKDLGKNSRTTVLEAQGAVMKNLMAYRSHFETKGWIEVLNKMSLGMVRELGGGSLIMQKGVDELIVTFLPAEDNKTRIVAVLVNKI